MMRTPGLARAPGDLGDDRGLVEHQVGVDASELGFYDFASRAAKRYRSELRDLTGWHECTKADLVKLVSHLVDVIWHDERREEQVRAECAYPFSFLSHSRCPKSVSGTSLWAGVDAGGKPSLLPIGQAWGRVPPVRRQ